MLAHRHHRRSGNSIRKMATHIVQQMAAVIPDLVAQIQQTLNPHPNNQSDVKTLRCSLKYFNSFNPPKFTGAEGATGMLQWFESMENIFFNSECLEDLRVQYATSVFQKRALTWWNVVKRTRGLESAMAMPWVDFKDLMTLEFCPRNEVKKLEVEFWDLKQEGGENLAYTTRFQELSLLVPHLVTPVSRAIEKYIDGLPMQIQNMVLRRNPAMLEDAIRLAATLSDIHVKARTLTRKGDKKNPDKAPVELKEAKTEPSTSYKKKRKFNSQNYALTTPVAQTAVATQPPRKAYTGTFPLCNRCTFHHPANVACRQCTACGRLGHMANVCRRPSQVQTIQPLAAQPMVQPANARSCFNCGDPNYFPNACPMLVIVNIAQANQADQGARGWAFNINANQTKANNEVVNGNAA